MIKKQPMITVFYDGKCGLCRKEIRYYQRIASEGIFDWRDITKSTTAMNQANVSLEQGLLYLHTIDQQGNLHIGVDSFILIWKNLSSFWKVIAFIVSLPLIKSLTSILYHWFAKRRFKNLSSCHLNT